MVRYNYLAIYNHSQQIQQIFLLGGDLSGLHRARGLADDVWLLGVCDALVALLLL